MASKALPLIFVIVFVFGWFCSSAYSTVISQISFISPNPDYSMDANIQAADSQNSATDRYIFKNKERVSPFDWISEDNIHLYKDRVVIELNNPQWAVFTDTNSMDPVIDLGTHAIEIIPESTEEIHVGDIISYNSDYAEGTIIHRVVEIGNDGEWYSRTKGDNNPFVDPGKIRFDQIQRVLVAIIY